jgi:hypothetical protein
MQVRFAVGSGKAQIGEAAVDNRQAGKKERERERKESPGDRIGSRPTITLQQIQTATCAITYV